MVEHQTAIMIVGFGIWGLIFVIWPLIAWFTRKPQA